MSELRDAIATEIKDASPWGRGMDGDDAGYCADAVLELAEMQAVREALHDMAQEIDNWSEDGGARYVLDYKYNLPASVVAWVLDGKQ